MPTSDPSAPPWSPRQAVWTDAVRVTELEVALAPARPWRAPVDLARLQRSVLGRAVFELACARDHQRCDGCDRADSCEIPTWYDPGRGGDHAIRPLVPAPLGQGGGWVGPERPLHLRWWLLGHAPWPSLLVSGLLRLARTGLGAERVPHRVVTAIARGGAGPAPVIVEDRPAAPWPEPGGLSAFAPHPGPVRSALVQVLSPLRWKGAHPGRAPTVGQALWAMIDHARKVVRAQGLPQPPPWPDPRPLSQPWGEARWVARDRGASGGGQQDLSGWVGGFSLGPEVRGWSDVLAAAEILGAGASTSAGCGRISVAWRR